MIIQSLWQPQNSYFEVYLFLQNTFFNGCFCSFTKFQWLMHTFFSYWNFWMQLLNLEQRHVVQSFFVQIRYYKDKVASWESCNKNIESLFKHFRMQMFYIYNLKSKGRTRLVLIALFSFSFKKKPHINV